MCLSDRNPAYVIVTILLILSIWYISYICSYYSINPFPSSYEISKPITITYPPNLEKKSQPVLLMISFKVRSNKAIREGDNITLIDIHANLSREIYNNPKFNNITLVDIGFQGTNPYFIQDLTKNNTPMVIAPWGAHFFVNRSKYDPKSLIPPPLELVENDEINFPLAGDYSPWLKITPVDASFSNGSWNVNMPPPISYTSEFKLHVPSISENQAKGLNTINAFISIILLFIGFIEIIKLIREFK